MNGRMDGKSHRPLLWIFVMMLAICAQTLGFMQMLLVVTKFTQYMFGLFFSKMIWSTLMPIVWHLEIDNLKNNGVQPSGKA